MIIKGLLLYSLVCLSHFSEAQHKWSLEDCIAYAQKNNLSITGAGIQKRLSALAVEQNKASKWPSLNFGGNSGYRFGLSENPTTGILQGNNFFSTGFNVTAGATLFNWFSKQHTLRASVVTAAADEMAIKKIEDDVILNVNAAFLQVSLAMELIQAAALQLQQTLAQAEVVRKKIALGVLSSLDASQVQVQVLTDSAALLSAEEGKEKSLLQLKAVLNIDPATALDIVLLSAPDFVSQTLFTERPEVIYTNASENLPQLKVLHYQTAAAQERVKATRAARYPLLSVYGAAGSNFVNIPSSQSFVYVPQQATGAKVIVNGATYDVMAPSYQTSSYGVTPFFRQLHKNFGQNVGISLIVPLFNSKALTIAWKREQLNLTQLKLQTEQARQEVRSAVYTAYTEANVALKKIKLNERIVTEAKAVYEAAQKRFALNLLSTQDLLIYSTSVEKAKIDLLTAQYDFLFKMKLLEYYRTGKLNDKVK